MSNLAPAILERQNYTLQALAVRAKARRLELGLSCSYVASLCGMIPATLSLWERRLPTKTRPQETAWETALSVPEGWLRNESVRAVAAAELAPASSTLKSEFPRSLKLTTAERQMLGERAKLRRNELSMSRQHAAGNAGTHLNNLILWERLLPAVRRSVEENWEKALQVPPGWLRDLSIEIPDEGPLAPLAIPSEETVAAEIRRIGNWTARKRIYQRTFHSEDLSDAESASLTSSPCDTVLRAKKRQFLTRSVSATM